VAQWNTAQSWEALDAVLKARCPTLDAATYRLSYAGRHIHSTERYYKLAASAAHLASESDMRDFRKVASGPYDVLLYVHPSKEKPPSCESARMEQALTTCFQFPFSDMCRDQC